MSNYSFLKNIYFGLYNKGLLNFIPDKFFVPILYRIATGERLDLRNPTTFNEKLQWIKMYDRNPLYTQVVDKFRVREFVIDRIGEQFLIPILGKWDSIDEIDFEKLPEKYVLKCNHDSGGIVICTNKQQQDLKSARNILERHMKNNHYYLSREWAYKDVKPCIIAEKYMIDDKTHDLRDYKFFCFNGEPKYIQVDFDRFIDHKRNIYDLNWNLVDLTIKCPNDVNSNLECPSNLEEMIEVAKKLSVGFPEVRVDLYSVNGRTYFGEMTLYHGGGIEKFTPESYGDVFGSYIDLGLCKKG